MKKILLFDQKREEEAFSPQKRTFSISSFYCFVLALLDPDPTGQNQQKSLRIRIHNTGTGILYIIYLCTDPDAQHWYIVYYIPLHIHRTGR
jgi:hypothetical protein